jgi:hypothetical protein
VSKPKPHVEYGEELTSPIVRRLPGLLASDEEKDKALRHVGEQRASKLPALFSAHGVTQGDWEGLAMALAEIHVTGFHVQEAPGRSVTRPEHEKALFRIAVDASLPAVPDGQKQKRGALKAAIMQACKHPVFADWSAGLTYATLKDYYSKVDSRMVSLARGAIAFDALPEEVKQKAEAKYSKSKQEGVPE